jgi:hypothetical protein
MVMMMGGDHGMIAVETKRQDPARRKIFFGGLRHTAGKVQPQPECNRVP